MQKEEVYRRVKAAVIAVLDLKVSADEIPDDGLLFGDASSVDSMATLEIICALEEEFGVEVADEDLRVELFASVSSIADYLMDILANSESSRVA